MRQLASSEVKTAFAQAPSSLPTNSQFFLLCGALHNRNNYLFVGDLQAGRNLAGLYSLVATCEARGINPFEYLADVLPRVSDHPQSHLDDLLPGPWAAARG